MPPIGTKNLGLIKAIHVGVNPPLNTKILWYNDATTPYNTGPAKVHYYYDVIMNDWYPLKGLGGSEKYTYIAFASDCEGEEDFSFDLDKEVHCYWAIIVSDTEIETPNLVPDLFIGRWTSFCTCSTPGGGGTGLNTYIAFADDCEGLNFSFDPMDEVECTSCQWADSYNVSSGSGAYQITPNGNKLTVDVTSGIAGNQIIIDLTLGGQPLNDLVKYCIQITSPLQYSGKVDIHLGDVNQKISLDNHIVDWKSEVMNNGSQLVIKIPDDFAGIMTSTFEIQVGTLECYSEQIGDKCYKCRKCWGVIMSPVPLEEVTAEMFEGRWVNIGCCDSSSSDYSEIFNLHTTQIENLNQQLLDYMIVNDQRFVDMQEVINDLQREMEGCCDRLQLQINDLEDLINNYIESNDENTGVIIGDVEGVKGDLEQVKGILTEDGLAPLTQPTIDNTLQVFIRDVYNVGMLNQSEYTDSILVEADQYTDGKVQPIIENQNTNISDIEDHEMRITTLEGDTATS